MINKYHRYTKTEEIEILSTTGKIHTTGVVSIAEETHTTGILTTAGPLTTGVYAEYQICANEPGPAEN